MINHLKNAPNANRDLNGAIKAAQQAAEDLKAAYQQNHSASAQPLANAMADVGSECSEVQSSLIVDPD